jgi:hypothetical protein
MADEDDRYLLLAQFTDQIQHLVLFDYPKIIRGFIHNQHRQYDDHTDHDILPERLHVEHDQTGRHHGDNQGADQSSADAAFTAKHADLADNHSSN